MMGLKSGQITRIEERCGLCASSCDLEHLHGVQGESVDIIRSIEADLRSEQTRSLLYIREETEGGVAIIRSFQKDRGPIAKTCLSATSESYLCGIGLLYVNSRGSGRLLREFQDFLLMFACNLP